MPTDTQPKEAPAETARRVTAELQHQIEQHYYTEARMLQDGLYREWLEHLVAPDIHYWLPVYEQRFRRDKRPAPTPDDAAIYNDDYAMLKMRVERLYTGQVWMEDPPSRIRHNISNVEAYHTEIPGELRVYSNFTIQRHRRQTEHYTHTGGREDLLRQDGTTFKLARRKIDLDARVVQDKNLYFFA
ncbi:3-phenylpropionate/cinnamic acid dioxygenase subunit beta [Halieaceae bacterium IMCC8485]|uniref:3-phenylpropionate/cinnamic acid dioxygenase subunit beta n=1 Tax=Candidatus Seongchinamella marina TaxID=2518990 RepID=A0ABT3SZP2_9GAMM|nr:aromatic-ring-hydroxylating dioxygenase subunit beta [Candidatus Seongchinamella marina]MCX2975477.1 3-phenylpropionate/cinnamic acid dioxygenase subunit beta [Candidatus Seongchinamella marina]